MEPAAPPVPPSPDVVVVPSSSPFRSEDLWSIWIGGALLLAALAAAYLSTPVDEPARLAAYQKATREYDALVADPQADPERVKALAKSRDELKGKLVVNPLKAWVAKLGTWEGDPSQAFYQKPKAKPGAEPPPARSILPGLGVVFLLSLIVFGVGLVGMRQRLRTFPVAFLVVFLLAVLAYLMAGQKLVNSLNLEYALWAILLGFLISNTVGTPRFMRPALRTEFYIKTGLVLLGAEVLLNRLVALGLPGICMSWLVTPVVLISTYAFGQKVLKIPSKSLNMVICADMSVCGVSAAIATAAACKAKKEELSLAIGLSLAFTVLMMVVMPGIIAASGMGPVVGGAWLGGTIDSTGAVAAAGGMVGDQALAVATVVKMIQNILIGPIAFFVAVYWVSRVERTPDGRRPHVSEIWRRFPKFILGFLAASVLFSAIAGSGDFGAALTESVTKDVTRVLRDWFFCLAFVSIGLETNLRELSQYFVGGKPLVLYVVGQTINLALSLLMAWIMFVQVFPDAAASLR